MPKKPTRPCRYPGCPNLTTEGSYCPEHTRLVNQQYEKQREIADPYRKKFYGSRRWQNLRKIVLNRDPVCAICGVKPATDVDHVDGDRDNNDPANLQGLCHECHSRKTAKQDGRWGKF